MCKFGGKGGMFSGGGLGGILGSLGGLGLDFAFPELGIPLSLATGLGGGLGSLFGGLASGEKLGPAALGGLESGALSGALSGIGEVAAGNDFFAAPGGTGISGLFGGADNAAAPSTAGIAASPSSITSTALPDLTSASAAVPTDNLTAAATTGGPLGPSLTSSNVIPASGIPSSPLATSADMPGLQSTATDSSFASGATGTGSKILDWIKSNPGILLGGGGILASLLMNNNTPGLGTLQNEANMQAAQGNQMARSLQTGQLPAGAQAALDQAMQAAKATTHSTDASLGISGSTMEGQSVAGIDQAAAAQKFGMLKDLTSMGLQEVGAADSLYKTIMDTEIAQDRATSDAISRIAAALAGGGFKSSTANA